MEARSKIDTDMDMAMAKLKATEMLAMVADEALQIHGGMGLMSDLPLERIWRDARIETDLGRHQRGPAAHHFAQPAAPLGRLALLGARPRPTAAGGSGV